VRLAHFGTFDVDNYGDLLFPLLAEWRLPEVDWVHVSPRGGRPRFLDAADPICFDDVGRQPVDAVVVGGGNIVHLRRTSLATYVGLARTAYPSLSLGAAHLAATRGVPLLINGPSVRKCNLGVVEKILLRQFFKNSTYAAMRDLYSVEVMQALAGMPCQMIPDTAFDISRMWPVPKQSASGKYIVVHVNHRYGGDSESAAKAIDKIAKRSGCEVRFLPIGPCHGDLEYMHEIIRKMSSVGRPVVKLSLRGFAAEIANSQAYIGSSMHGFITAVSYGVPSLLVLDKHPMEKFSGLLCTLNAPSDIACESWEYAARRIQDAWKPSDIVYAKLFGALDAHWEQMRLTVLGESRGAITKKMPTSWKALARAAQFEVLIRQGFSWLNRKFF